MPQMKPIMWSMHYFSVMAMFLYFIIFNFHIVSTSIGPTNFKLPKTLMLWNW